MPSAVALSHKAADLICRYWYLIARNPLWLVGLIPGVDPRRMSAGDALRLAKAHLVLPGPRS